MQIGRFVIRRGLASGISEGSHVLSEGELGYTVDGNKLVYIGTSNGDKQLLTRVRGQNGYDPVSYTEFRSGDVTITKEDIGLGLVSNKLDINRKVEYSGVAGGLSTKAGSTGIPVYFPEPSSQSDSVLGKNVLRSVPTPITRIDQSILKDETYSISITGNANTATTATRLATSAGNTRIPVYFSNGVPAVVSKIDNELLKGETYDINITGNANTATKANKAKELIDPVGSETNPVYVNSSGVVTRCAIYSDRTTGYKNFVAHVNQSGQLIVGNIIDLRDPSSSASLATLTASSSLLTSNKSIKSDGDITANGNLTATNGSISAKTNISTSSGNILAGNVTTTGAGNIVASGNIITNNGYVYGAKTYNAVWNDYADALPKEENIEYGMIVAINPETGKYRRATSKTNKLVVGVCSDTYGHLLGGEALENPEDNLKKYVPVAVAGNVKVYVIGKINAGDLITVSSIDGVGMKANRFFHKPGTIVGKALQSIDCNDPTKILMQVMLK